MKIKKNIRISIMLSVVILLSFVFVGFLHYNTYSNIIRQDIVNISKLTGMNIYSDISNELTKPIFVSLTMANDSFLKQWLSDEAAGNDSPAHADELIQYLQGIKEKYQYDSVFLVSETSKRYYHFEGLNKIISEDEVFDQWYFNFINTFENYELNVDADEMNNHRLAIFINCRIEDEEGNLLGVTGVGLEMTHLQALLRSFEEDFNLEAMLFSKSGEVQVHTNADLIENYNVFDDNQLSKHRGSVLGNQYALDVYPFGNAGTSGYYITRYIDDLDWYLLVEKDTEVLAQSYQRQLLIDFAIIAIVIAIVIFSVDWITRRHQKVLERMAVTDNLTKLPNRHGFSEELECLMEEHDREEELFGIIFDIDNFKKVNDEYGHLAGDKLLQCVGRIGQEVFSEKGMLCRWGGDEFAGYILASEEEARDQIDKFFSAMHASDDLRPYGTTVSLGVTKANRIDTVQNLLYRADIALYEAKAMGKDQYTRYDVFELANEAD